MSLKSHSIEEILEAYERGEKVYSLDSGNSGEDDILIGEKNEIIRNLCDYHEFDELPEHWALEPMDKDVFVSYYCQEP